MRYPVAADGTLGTGCGVLRHDLRARRGGARRDEGRRRGTSLRLRPRRGVGPLREGKHLGTLRFPELPANMAWGDADGRTLYLTARTSLYRLRLGVPGIRPVPLARVPMSGGVQVGVGLRPPHYAACWRTHPRSTLRGHLRELPRAAAPVAAGRPLETLERVRALPSGPAPRCVDEPRLGGSALRDYLARLRALADRLDPECVSDHVCWNGEGGENLHDLLPLPWTEEALEHLVARVHHAQERLGRRLLLENPRAMSATLHSTMTEWEFLGELARRTGAGLLVDVNNVFVTARNHGFRPQWFLDGLPAGAVEQFHLSGHDDSGRCASTPTTAQVCPEVWDALPLRGAPVRARPTIVEWDDRFRRSPRCSTRPAAPARCSRRFPMSASPSLAELQRWMRWALTHPLGVGRATAGEGSAVCPTVFSCRHRRRSMRSRATP